MSIEYEKSENGEYEHMAITQKIIDMIEYGHLALKQYEKSEKLSLCLDIKRCYYAMLRHALAAEKKYYKKTTLQELDTELATLKVYTRLSHDLGFLPPKKYEHWTKLNVEIGKMLGGWIQTNAEKPVK